MREAPAPLLGQLLREQAALADQLQAARDIVLESPRTPRRQRLAGMLIVVLELRDLLLASELDLDALQVASRPTRAALAEMRARAATRWPTTRRRWPTRCCSAARPTRRDRPPRTSSPAIRLDDDRRAAGAAGGRRRRPRMLARGLASRIGHINDEVLRLSALARGDAEPDLAVVRANWQMFVSPTDWSLRALPRAVALGRAAAAPRDPRGAGHRHRLRDRACCCPGARTTTGSC